MSTIKITIKAPIIPQITTSSSQVAIPTLSSKNMLTKDSLVLKPSDPKEEYRRRDNEKKNVVHWGQLKLGMAVLAFMTYYWDSGKVPGPIVVYAGAAPGDNIKLLIKLFPQVRQWHLFDPRSINIKSTDNKVIVYSGEEKGYFSNQYAKQFAGRNDILFISDIRTGGNRAEVTGKEFEQAVWRDNLMQKEWVDIMKPVYAHLKFRLPYAGNNLPQYYEYYDGTVLLQPWVGPTSGETRLVVSGNNLNTVGWDNINYEQYLFYHNVKVREGSKYSCKYSSEPLVGVKLGTDQGPIDVYQLGQDWDSMMTIQILGDYLVKAGMGDKFNTDPAGFRQDIANLFSYIIRLLNHQLDDDPNQLTAKYLISPAISRVITDPEHKNKVKDYNRWLLAKNNETDGMFE